MKSSALLSVLDAVESAWSVEVPGAMEVLGGGQESTAVRIGDLVVRIGPEWRPTVEAEWCYSVAESLSHTRMEVVAPLRSRSGKSALRIANRSVSVWPYVDGVSGDRDDAVHREQAASTLAALHRAANRLRTPMRPPMSAPVAVLNSPVDDELDRWLSEFLGSRPKHVLHGDFYPGNVVFSDQRLVGLVDWDEAVVDAPEIELAVAACEWGDLLGSGDLGGAVEFVGAYIDQGGTAEQLNPEDIAQLYRARLRWELAYEERCSSPLDSLNAEQRSYRLRQLTLFENLRP